MTAKSSGLQRRTLVNKLLLRQGFGLLSAGIVAAKGVVVAGDLAGDIEAYDATDGDVLWRYKTATSFPTVNDVPAQGGSIDSHGPLL